MELALACTISIYVAGFAKRGLQHTSNCRNLEGHNLVCEKPTNLKFSLDACVWKTSFHKSGHISSCMNSNFQCFKTGMARACTYVGWTYA